MAVLVVLVGIEPSLEGTSKVNLPRQIFQEVVSQGDVFTRDSRVEGRHKRNAWIAACFILERYP